MDSLTAESEIAALREEIRRHDYLYYVAAQPVISDYDYDQLMRRLEELERQFPDLRTADSPTQRVGGAPLPGFQSARHPKPMLSLANCYNAEELRAFHQRVRELYGREPEYSCELKIDGVSARLVYEGRRLILGVTRGDGETGDDITANIRTVRAIPLTVPDFLPASFEVRGEVYMPRAAFEEMNRQRTEAGEKTFMNPRNATAGTLKLLDSREVAKRPLWFFAWSLIADPSEGWTQWTTMDLLVKSGFPVNKKRRLCQTIDEVFDFWTEWDVRRGELPYDTDGVVVKLNDLEGAARLGTTSKSPRASIAFKYSPTEAFTTLNAVSWQVGRTGAVTPVAELEPILLMGTVVKRATLHNVDEIARLGLRIGDKVEVYKGGDIIPKVVRVIEEYRPAEALIIEMPQTCPACQTPLMRDEEEVVIRCPNPTCPAQVRGRIIHFASRGALDIEGLGEKTVDLLVSEALVSDVGDLYRLTMEQIKSLPRQAELSAENLLKGLDKSKRQPFDRLLFGLGIRQVGSGGARLIAARFSGFEELRRATIEELQAIPEVGPTTAQAVAEYFQNESNNNIIDKLITAGVTGAKSESAAIPQKFAGMTFVLTGTLDSLTREEAEAAIRARGGRAASSVSKKTTYVVAGRDAGSKLAKARELGVKVIDEGEFIKLLEF